MSDIFEKIERTAWESLSRFGGRPAVYRQGEREVSLTAVPCLKDANAFTFAGLPMFEKSQVFEIARTALDGIEPKKGDTLTIDGQTCIIGDNAGKNIPCWVDVGCYGVSVQIHTGGYRRVQ